MDAHTWGGSYKPKVKQFDVGNFVYLQWQPNDILDTSFGRTILKIKAIMPSVRSSRMHNLGSFQKLCTLPLVELGSYHHHVDLDSSIWLYMSGLLEDRQMLIRCYFGIIIMVDTIYSASS